jgi:hypothetical protein
MLSRRDFINGTIGAGVALAALGTVSASASLCRKAHHSDFLGTAVPRHLPDRRRPLSVTRADRRMTRP